MCDTDPRAGPRRRPSGTACPRSPTTAQLLDAVRPDVVHVCTPHDQHVPVAVDCLGAGVAVLLEKPVAHTVAEADELIDAAAPAPGR